jgi:3,4-dihydroxy-2-butanone 4-phosphate synthase
MRVPEERLKEAVSAVRRGEFVMVFDSEGREGETDLVILSERATPSKYERFWNKSWTTSTS